MPDTNDRDFIKQIAKELSRIDKDRSNYGDIFDQQFKLKYDITAKMFDNIIQQYDKYLSTILDMEKANAEDVYNATVGSAKLMIKKREELEKLSIKNSAAKENAIRMKYLTEYKKADIEEKKRILESVRKQTDAYLTAYEERRVAGEKLLDAEIADEERLSKLKKQSFDQELRMNRIIADVEMKHTSFAQKRLLYQQRAANFQKAVDAAKQEYEADVKYINKGMIWDEAEDRYRRGTNEELANAKKGSADRLKEAILEAASKYGFGKLFEEGGALNKLLSGLFKDDLVNVIGTSLSPVITVISTIVNVLGQINKQIVASAKEQLTLQSQYMGKVDTRLLGLTDISREDGSYYKYISRNIKDITAGTSALSNKDYLNTIINFIDQGVAFNVEERALLQSLGDKLVTTFNALDANVTRLVRLQQADVTTSLMGQEAQLNSFLNSNFKDTSYLNGDYDSVASTLLTATSQMTPDDAAAFSYNVQKWLGSLYSLGMSSQGVSTLAQGFAALATGDVNTFNSNDALRTLFASATNGTFASNLTGGVSASAVDAIMTNIVSYLASVSTSGNNVTRNQLASIFGGMDLSDIRAVSNLTQSDISSITSSQITNSADAVNYLNSLVSTIDTRTSEGEIVTNSINNFIWDVASKAISNPIGLAGYLLEDAIGSNIISTVSQGFADFKALWNTASDYDFTNVGYSNIPLRAGVQYTTRGGQYSPYIGTVVPVTGTVAPISGISSSGAIAIANTSSSDLAQYSLEKTAAMTTSSSSTYRDATAGLIRDVGDIYAELFEKQNHPIRIKLAEVEENAAAALDNYMTKNIRENVNDLNEVISFGKVNVDVVDSDINRIVQTTYSVRGI